MPKQNFFNTTKEPVLYKATRDGIVHYYLADNSNLEENQVRRVCSSLQKLGLLDEISFMVIEAGTYYTKKDFPFEVSEENKVEHDDVDDAEHHEDDVPHAPAQHVHRVRKTINAKDSITETMVAMANEREMPVFTLETKSDRKTDYMSILFKLATKPHNIAKMLAAGPANLFRGIHIYNQNKREKRILASDYMNGEFDYSRELMERNPVITRKLVVERVDRWGKEGYRGKQDTPTRTPMFGKQGMISNPKFAEVKNGLSFGGALFVISQGPLIHSTGGVLAHLKKEGWEISPVRTSKDVVCRKVRPADEVEPAPVHDHNHEPDPAPAIPAMAS